MKKRIFAVAMVIACLAILTSTTLAYFTTAEVARNVITSGGVRVQIEEWQDEDGTLVAYPDRPIKIMPSTTVSKIVKVRNMEADAFARARFDIVIKKPDGSVMEVEPEDLEKFVSVTMDGEHWIRKTGDSQWWYYSGILAGGKTTEPFITDVVFDGPNMTNEYQNCTMEIIVEVQAVQAANNGSSVKYAAGWPVA